MARNDVAIIAGEVIASKVTLVLAALASAVITLALFSDGKTERELHSPASNAEAVYGNLMSQIGSSNPANGAASWGPALPPGTRTQERASKLSRNLFAPPRRETRSPARSTKPVFRPARPSPPRLTGILIDGAARKAMVGGTMVSQGDVVSGYTVVEIARSWVVLEKEGTTYTLLVGKNND